MQFETEEDCEKALKRNLEKIGHRWVGWILKYTKKISTKLLFFNQKISKKSISLCNYRENAWEVMIFIDFNCFFF